MSLKQVLDFGRAVLRNSKSLLGVSISGTVVAVPVSLPARLEGGGVSLRRRFTRLRLTEQPGGDLS